MVQAAVQRFKRSRGLTYVELAELFEISHDHARKLGSGAVERVSAELGLRMEKRSGGEITAEEVVLPEKFGAKRARRSGRVSR